MLLLAGRDTYAQQGPAEEESVLEEDIRWLTIYEQQAALDFRYEFEDDKETQFDRTRLDNSTGASNQRRQEGEKTVRYRTRDKETAFEERFNLTGHGAVYHPSLLEYRSFLSFGLRQDEQRGTFKDNENETLKEYDIDMKFLQHKKLNFNLFFNSFDSSVKRDFFSSVDVTTSNAGGYVRYEHDFFPMSLHLQHNRTESDATDYQRDRKENTLEYTISNNIGNILDSELSYIYDKTDETYRSQVSEDFPYSLTRHEINLMNIYDYKKTHGTSNLSYYKWTGDFGSDQVQLNENFYVDHSETFRTLYNYNFNYFKTGQFNSTLNLASIGCTHRLYQSLVTDLRLELQNLDDSDLKQFYYEPGIALEYNKKVPGGLFTANCSFAYQITSQTDKSKGDETVSRRVFQEPVVLSYSNPAMLKNRGARAGSLVVRDAAGIILKPNIDYRVVQIGNGVEVMPIGGAADTSVYVDYEYPTFNGSDYNITKQGLYLRYLFRQLLSVYYSKNSSTYDTKIAAAKSQHALPAVAAAGDPEPGQSAKLRRLPAAEPVPGLQVNAVRHRAYLARA